MFRHLVREAKVLTDWAAQCMMGPELGVARRRAEPSTLQQVCRRTLTNSARRQVENKVPQNQKHFQEDNGLPVHLKGGVSDAILYRATMALTVLGTVLVVYEVGKAAFPQKK